MAPPTSYMIEIAWSLPDKNKGARHSIQVLLGEQRHFQFQRQANQCQPPKPPCTTAGVLLDICPCLCDSSYLEVGVIHSEFILLIFPGKQTYTNIFLKIYSVTFATVRR